MATIWFAVNQPAFAFTQKKSLKAQTKAVYAGLCEDLANQIAHDYFASRQTGTSVKFIHRAQMLTDVYIESGCSAQELGRHLTRK